MIRLLSTISREANVVFQRLMQQCRNIDKMCPLNMLLPIDSSSVFIADRDICAMTTKTTMTHETQQRKSSYLGSGGAACSGTTPWLALVFR